MNNSPHSFAYNKMTSQLKDAFVTDKSARYLWLLSRHPSVPKEIKSQFIQKITALGVDESTVIWVDQIDNLAGANG